MEIEKVKPKLLFTSITLWIAFSLLIISSFKQSWQNPTHPPTPRLYNFSLTEEVVLDLSWSHKLPSALHLPY